MLKLLRWIEGIDWPSVWLASFLCSFTLSLVFAGTVNESVDQRMTENVLSPSHSAQPNQNSTLPDHATFPKASLENTDEISLYIDLSKNLLMVKRGSQIIYTALAATGSGKELQDPRNPSRKWKFETPRGTFTIKNKLKKPVWIRPDWAFIEKGVPVPHDRKRRLLPNSLGDYALGFGDGYFIHGALYTYLLGFNVTHGCIQLNEEDLQYIYDTVPVGTTLVIA